MGYHPPTPLSRHPEVAVLEKTLTPLLSLLLASCASATLQEAVSPAEHLGRPVGTDFELADWEQVSSYYRRLAEASPRVQVETVGQSTEGRDFLVATVSGEANIRNLDSIKAMTARIADPRGLSEVDRAALIGEARAVVFVSCSMHSTETAGTEFGMQLAWTLATSEAEPWVSAREELVVVIVPTVNPDGLDHVVHWYREHVGGPFEASGLLKLYQYYTGHDNNRDWFGLSQAETRHVTRQIYSVWHPQVYWDVHQQGSSGERFFVPPFRDPLNPNLDPGIISGIDAVGSRALWDLTRDGYTGVSTGVSYDMWWNGGNRNVPVRHNIIGLLTEAASVNIATPIFLQPSRLRPPGDLAEYAPSNRFPAPWPGGWWRLADIIDYELAFAESLLGSVAREKEEFLWNAVQAAERAIEAGIEGAPKAWLLPSDNADVGAARRLVEILLLGGVEVYLARAEFEADGRTWPAGSVVIPREQPYGAHVKDLFEVQRYPEGPSPYDVSGWTLPLLFGLRRVEVMGELEVELQRVEDPARAVAAFGGEPLPAGVLPPRDSDGWMRLFAHLGEGGAAHFDLDEDRAGTFALGTPEETLHREPPVEEPAGDDPAGPAQFDPVFGEGAPATDPSGPVVLEGLPRIGVYAPWSGSMNEGWLRWVLDTWGVRYIPVRNEMLRAGELSEFLDVLILPSISGGQLDAGRSPGSVPDEYTRGLDPEGAVAIEEFVRGGGVLVAMQSSASWAIELFELPLTDTTRGEEAGEFSCPGSVLRSIPGEGTAALGLPDSLPIFFSRAAAWEVEEDEHGRELEVLLRYAPTRVLLSGWIRGEEAIEGRAAWVRARHGEGAVQLFAFRPQYRSWSQAAFPLLFRAILLGHE